MCQEDAVPQEKVPAVARRALAVESQVATYSKELMQIATAACNVGIQLLRVFFISAMMSGALPEYSKDRSEYDLRH